MDRAADEHPTQYHPDLPGLDKTDIRWNFVTHALEGGLYIGGLAFVAANSVLPRIVDLLGGPAWVIGLTPVLTMIGFNVLPILTAHLVESMERVKPLLMLAGVFQRLPYLLAGLLLYYLGDSRSEIVLWVVVATPLMSGLAGGLIVTAWQELVAKTVPNNRRSSIFATRNIISAAIGIGAGGTVAAVLDQVPGIRGYALLHLIAFGFLLLSYLVFMNIREGRHEQRSSAAHRRLRDNVAEAISILGGDRKLQRYVTTVPLVSAMYVMVPFLPIYTLEATGRPDSFLGLLVTAQMVGGITGNAIAGYLGDRFGGRSVMLLGRGLLVGACVWAATATQSWAFVAVFFLMGWGLSSNMVGQSTMAIEFCPFQKRSTYLAIISSANVPAMLLFSLGGAWLRGALGSFPGVAAVAAALLAASLLLLLRIPEPRRAGA